MPLRTALTLLSWLLAASAARPAEVDYELAREALEAERPDEVRRLLSGAAESGDAEALHLLGRAEFAAGRVDEALEYFTKARKQQPELSRSHFWYGRACHVKLDEAAKLFKPKWAKRMRTAFEKAHELDPTDTKPILALARFHREAPGIVGGDRETSYEHATTLARLDPRLGEPFLAGLLTEDERHDEAVAAYRRALEASPDVTGLRHALVASLARAGHAERAFAEIDALLALDPADPLAPALEGFIARGRLRSSKR